MKIDWNFLEIDLELIGFFWKLPEISGTIICHLLESDLEISVNIWIVKWNGIFCYQYLALSPKR